MEESLLAHIFTPQPLRAVRVLFLLMVSGWAGGWEKVCPGCVSEPVRCRKLVLGRDIGWGFRCVTSWCDLNLSFGLAVMTLTLKILSRVYISETVRCQDGWTGWQWEKFCPGCISEPVRCRKLILGRDIGGGWRCATSWCNLDLTFDLAIVTLNFKILSGLCLGNRKV